MESFNRDDQLEEEKLRESVVFVGASGVRRIETHERSALKVKFDFNIFDFDGTTAEVPVRMSSVVSVVA